MELTCAPRRLDAVEARHRHVDQEQVVDLAARERIERGMTALRFGHSVAELAQHLGAYIAHRRVIVDDEDAPTDTLAARVLAGGLARIGHDGRARQVEMDRGSDTRAALDPHRPVRLLHHAVDLAEAEPAALAQQSNGTMRIESRSGV